MAYTKGQHRAVLLRRLFDSPAPHDVASVVSYRDALDRADRLDTPAEAVALLRRARLTGDELLARAVAVRAADLVARSAAWGEVLDEWAAQPGSVV